MRRYPAFLQGIVEDWEVVYVNDGSTDSTLELLKSLQALDPHVVVVELSRNWGQVGAIFAGLRTASGRAVILMDADFQDPPEVVPQLIDAWRGGAEVVVAVRRSRQERRKILALLFPLFYRVLGAISDYPMSLNAGLFGLMDRKAVDSILAMGEKNPYLPGLRAWVGYRNTIVYYDRQDRLGGEGKLSFMSRIKYATDAIMSFSYKPIRLSFVLMLPGNLRGFPAWPGGVDFLESDKIGSPWCRMRSIPHGRPVAFNDGRVGRIYDSRI